MNFLELRKAEVQLPRIPIPRTRVNKGISKGRNPLLEESPGRLLVIAHSPYYYSSRELGLL
jgi:hypothetical protein